MLLHVLEWNGMEGKMALHVMWAHLHVGREVVVAEKALHPADKLRGDGLRRTRDKHSCFCVHNCFAVLTSTSYSESHSC